MAMLEPTLDMRPQGRIESISHLIANLEALGVQVAAADRWRTLRGVQPPGEPEPPADLLNATPADCLDYVAALGAWRAAGASAGGELTRLRDLLDTAMTRHVAECADDLVLQLRERFNGAAAVLRKAKELGITADDDERTMVRAADEVRSTWLQLHEAGATLDRVFHARQQLSTVAGAAPNLAGAALTVNQRDALGRGIGSTKVNWAVVVTRSGSARLAPRDPANAWVRWFDVTDELELRLPSELTADDLIRAYHEGLAGALYAEAEHRAGTHTEED